MNLSQIYIVLCNPENSQNVGAVCRSMETGGITHLRIVGKRDYFDDEKVRTLAIHAVDLWDQAEFFDTLKDATSDCVLTAGTTRRRGNRRKGWLALPEEFIAIANPINEGKIAIVFGNERVGLSDEELSVCTIGVTIPTDDKFPSLNLSHAVQIICYELYRHAVSAISNYKPISLERLDKTIEKITDSLESIGFFKQTDKSDISNYWRAILSRSGLRESEAKYLEKLFNKASGLATHPKQIK